jgi:hypothetical protein
MNESILNTTVVTQNKKIPRKSGYLSEDDMNNFNNSRIDLFSFQRTKENTIDLKNSNIIKKNSLLFSHKEKLEEKMSKVLKKLPTVTSTRDRINFVNQKENTNTLDKIYKIASFQPEDNLSTARISKLQNPILYKSNSVQKDSFRFSHFNSIQSIGIKETNFISNFIQDLREKLKNNLEKKLETLSVKSK